MITDDNWIEHCEFEGYASAIVIIEYFTNSDGKRYQCIIDCYGLGNDNTKIPIRMFFWDERDKDQAREFYKSTFVRGSIWKISGRIEYDNDNSLVFTDPAFMPYRGNACKALAAFLD